MFGTIKSYLIDLRYRLVKNIGLRIKHFKETKVSDYPEKNKLQKLWYVVPLMAHLRKEKRRWRRIAIRVAYRECDKLSAALAIDPDNKIAHILAKEYWGHPTTTQEHEIVIQILSAEHIKDKLFYYFLDLDLLTKKQFFELTPTPHARATFLDSLKLVVNLKDARNGRLPVDYSRISENRKKQKEQAA